MNDWKAELDAFFQRRELQDQQHDHTQPSGGTTAIEEFMAAVATPACEEFAIALREHGCHIRLHQSDSHVRIISEYAGREEFDYTIWAGTSEIFAEVRSGGQHAPESFQNAKGTSAMTDTTREDITQHLVARYIALTSLSFA